MTTSASGPFCWSGRYSVSGRSPMTTAAAWIESLRTTPSSGRAMSTMLFAVSSTSYALRSSAPGFMHSSNETFGPSGTILAIRSTTP